MTKQERVNKVFDLVFDDKKPAAAKAQGVKSIVVSLMGENYTDADFESMDTDQKSDAVLSFLGQGLLNQIRVGGELLTTYALKQKVKKGGVSAVEAFSKKE